MAKNMMTNGQNTFDLVRFAAQVNELTQTYGHEFNGADGDSSRAWALGGLSALAKVNAYIKGCTSPVEYEWTVTDRCDIYHFPDMEPQQLASAMEREGLNWRNLAVRWSIVLYESDSYNLDRLLDALWERDPHMHLFERMLDDIKALRESGDDTTDEDGDEWCVQYREVSE